MNDFIFSERSKNNLVGVHNDLGTLAYQALKLSTVDFCITEGLRTIEQQKLLVKQGKSQTLNSRHLSGHAIDVFAYPDASGSWDFAYYEMIADAFKKASVITNLPIEWGGDWKTFKDGAHFQLPWRDYPL